MHTQRHGIHRPLLPLTAIMALLLWAAGCVTCTRTCLLCSADCCSSCASDSTVGCVDLCCTVGVDGCTINRQCGNDLSRCCGSAWLVDPGARGARHHILPATTEQGVELPGLRALSKRAMRF